MARHSVLIEAVEPYQKEATNGEGSALNPGDMVAVSAVDEVSTPSTAGEGGFRVVVDKYDVALDGSYADGEHLFFHVGQPGEEYYVNVTAQNTSGTGAAISVGDKLTNFTDGTLCTADSGEPTAIAKEAVSSGVSSQIKVEVL